MILIESAVVVVDAVLRTLFWLMGMKLIYTHLLQYALK